MKKVREIWYTFDSWLGGLEVCIKEDKNKVSIEDEDYYFTEFESTASESDYHSYYQSYTFKGVYLAFDLAVFATSLGENFSEELFDKEEFLKAVEKKLDNHNMLKKYDNHEIIISNRGYLQIVLLDKKLDEKLLLCANDVLKYIYKYNNKNNLEDIYLQKDEQKSFTK